MGSNVYYRLSVTSLRKSPKKTVVRSQNYDLSHINIILEYTLKNLRFIKSQKTKRDVKILALLDKIIPKEYFGTLQNRKMFDRVVKKILTQSYHECIYSTLIVKGYNFESISWLSHVQDQKEKEKLLLRVNTFLLDCVVKPLITFYYEPVRSIGDQVEFFRREKWTSFLSKASNEVKNQKFLVKNDNSKIKARGRLVFIPKGNLEDVNFRAICRSFQSTNCKFSKTVISTIHGIAQDKRKDLLVGSLYDAWAGFVAKTGDRKIYGIKLDVRDAYGNVNMEILKKIILGLSKEDLPVNMKSEVIRQIDYQVVCFQKTTFKWNHGLLQGDPFSGCLCELYMAHMDQLFLLEFNTGDCFLHRTVDDYFFCSVEEYQVEKFRSTVESVHQINKTKTVTNCDEIPYCGNLFNLVTREVKTFFNFEKDFPVRHKFRIWNFQNQIPEADYKTFLTKAMQFGFSSNFFRKMVMNTVFNTSKTVAENFFDAMVYVAYKLDAVVMALTSSNPSIENSDFVLPVIDHCCHVYSNKVFKNIVRWKGNFFQEAHLTLMFFKILAYKAFVLVLKRNSKVYQGLIAHIEGVHKLKVNLRKSNFDFKYFEILPPTLRHLRLSRKNNL